MFAIKVFCEFEAMLDFICTMKWIQVIMRKSYNKVECCLSQRWARVFVAEQNLSPVTHLVRQLIESIQNLLCLHTSIQANEYHALYNNLMFHAYSIHFTMSIGHQFCNDQEKINEDQLNT